MRALPWWRAAWLATLLAAMAAAQEEAAPPDAEPPPEPGSLEALVAEYEQAEENFMAPYREAKTDEERAAVKLDWSDHPSSAYQARFLAWAKENPGTEDTAEALLWVLRYTRSDECPEALEALDLLEKDHLDGPDVEGLAGTLRWNRAIPEERKTAILKRLEGSEHAGVRASALFARGQSLIGYGEIPEEARTEAREIFQTLRDRYSETPYAEKAEPYLFQIDKLNIGAVAPDFEATDETGKTFHLSDYRGKVVALIFWGFW